MVAPAKKASCLPAHRWRGFLAGEFDDNELESASEHLDGCSECQDAIERLAERPDWVTEDCDPLHDESACQIAVGRLIATSPPPLSQLGPYRILGTLGHGGMATVCLAQHERLKRFCAIKLLPPARVGQTGWLERFDREMAAVASLTHAGIVRADDAGCDAGWHYLVMEYLDGLDVGRVAQRIGSIPIADACEIARQTALALAHVHDSGLVHRDIKPSNVMLVEGGTVKLLDLGLVLAGDDPVVMDDRLTTAGHIMGTLPAMSPEQLLDSRHVTGSADVYSLGATLYRLIAGVWPFAVDGGIAARVLAITGGRLTPLAQVQDAVAKPLSDFVTTMLDRNPDKRPTANQVAERLSGWCGEANLNTLLARAKAIPSPDPSAIPRSVAAAADNIVVPPPPHKTRRLAGGFYAAGWIAAAAALAATVIIQIKAERGNVVVETDGEETTVQVVADGEIQPAVTTAASARKETAKLYVGKDYKQWVDIFHREQEITEIGTAMRAMELLSRDTPFREDAAKQTLEMASRYGTMRIDRPRAFGHFSTSEPDPAPTFMGYLMEVFPNYFPMPGIVQIETQMADENDRARTAAGMLLDNFLTGKWANVAYGPEDVALASKHFREMAQSSSGRERLTQLLLNLGRPIDDKVYGDLIRQDQWSTARSILNTVGQAVDTPKWVNDYVIEQTQSALAQWHEREIDPATGKTVPPPPSASMTGGGMFMIGGVMNEGAGTGATGVQMFRTPPEWLLPPDILTAAIELRSTGKLDFPTQFAVEVFADPSFQSYSESYQTAFDAIMTFDDAAPLVVHAVQDRLIGLLTRYHETKDSAELMQNGATAHLGPNTFLSLAGPVFAKHVDEVAAAQQLVEEILGILQDSPDPERANYLAIEKILHERAGDGASVLPTSL